MIYSDYLSMQQAAQRRVYEMQRRQRAALGRQPEQPENTPAPAEKKEEIPSDVLLLLALLAVLISDRSDPLVIALLLYLLG